MRRVWCLMMMAAVLIFGACDDNEEISDGDEVWSGEADRMPRYERSCGDSPGVTFGGTAILHGKVPEGARYWIFFTDPQGREPLCSIEIKKDIEFPNVFTFHNVSSGLGNLHVLLDMQGGATPIPDTEDYIATLWHNDMDFDRDMQNIELILKPNVENVLGTEYVCVDDDCPGAALCNAADICEVLCMGGNYPYNENCSNEHGFMTEAYGPCEAVPCEDDKDCLDLEGCDDPYKDSVKEFFCDEKNLCLRKPYDPPACTNGECPGAGLCNEADECVVLCLDSELGYNGDCFNDNAFMTQAYGECEPVPCNVDSDCRGLANCDDPEKDSLKIFRCLDFQCWRRL